MKFLNLIVLAFAAVASAQELVAREGPPPGPPGGDDNCFTCDCFKCGSVTPTMVSGVASYEILILSGGCKSDSISWLCCAQTGCAIAPGGCSGTLAGQKCNTVNADTFKVTVPASSPSVVINTHDGKSAGDANMQNGFCGGNGNQGQSCGSTSSAHCLKTFTIGVGSGYDCTVPPPAPTNPAPTAPAPTNPAPTNPAPTPVDPAPTNPAPTNPAPTNPAPTPVDPAPTNPAPTPVDPAPTNPAPTPVDPAPTPNGPAPAPTGPEFEGDPHLKSWTGEWFDYMGECDLKLLHAPKFDGTKDLDIHVRTTIRMDYSFIERAALRIGNDILEVGGYGDFALNGVDGAMRTDHMVPKIGGYQVYYEMENKKKHNFDIVISETENITLSTNKEWVSIKLNGVSPDMERFGGVTGMMGSFDGKMLARDGTNLHSNIDALGQDWQVRPEEGEFFRAAREPQFPSECILPSKSASATRRLRANGVTNAQAEAACGHLKGNARSFCIHDVIASGDVSMAEDM